MQNGMIYFFYVPSPNYPCDFVARVVRLLIIMNLWKLSS